MSQPNNYQLTIEQHAWTVWIYLCVDFFSMNTVEIIFGELQQFKKIATEQHNLEVPKMLKKRGMSWMYKFYVDTSL